MLTWGTSAPLKKTHDEPKKVGNPFIPALVPVETPDAPAPVPERERELVPVGAGGG